MRTELTLTLLGIGFIALGGGCAGAPPTSRPTSDAGVPEGVFETFRVAEPADLRLSIYGVRPAAKDFPFVLLTLQNMSNQDQIVAYERGTLIIHCGDFVQRGPIVFQRRRQVLSPKATIVFDPPDDDWAELAPNGEPELMIPVKLPPGKYTLWATFQVAGRYGGTIRSDERTYEVKKG